MSASLSEFKYEIGDNVWVYGYDDAFESAKIVERYIVNGHRVYYVHAESFKGTVNETFIRS